jgi:transposase
VQNCIGLIERHAARMMRVGGGSVCGEDYQINRRRGKRMTAKQKARVVDLAKTGQYYQTAIARVVGVTQSSVWHLLHRLGLKCPDARKDFGCPAHKRPLAA